MTSYHMFNLILISGRSITKHSLMHMFRAGASKFYDYTDCYGIQPSDIYYYYCQVASIIFIDITCPLP